MNKPNLMETVEPGSGQYSFRADLRLNRWLAVAVVLHLVGQYFVGHRADWSAFLRATVALAPLVPGLLYVRSWVGFVRGLDEFQRRIQVEAFLFAALGTTILGAAIGSLNAQKVPTGPFADGMGLGETFMAMLCLWSVGWGLAKCRYK
ncbi:MAG TPA: hypothetical protein VG734_01250 [Lacunisphaera sp.]|nr:hypothetical protein [Lacunisphaera sp.]